MFYSYIIMFINFIMSIYEFVANILIIICAIRYISKR